MAATTPELGGPGRLCHCPAPPLELCNPRRRSGGRGDRRGGGSTTRSGRPPSRRRRRGRVSKSPPTQDRGFGPHRKRARGPAFYAHPPYKSVPVGSPNSDTNIFARKSTRYEPGEYTRRGLWTKEVRREPGAAVVRSCATRGRRSGGWTRSSVTTIPPVWGRLPFLSAAPSRPTGRGVALGAVGRDPVPGAPRPAAAAPPVESSLC